jgi:hypothetical protein
MAPGSQPPAQSPAGFFYAAADAAEEVGDDVVGEQTAAHGHKLCERQPRTGSRLSRLAPAVTSISSKAAPPTGSASHSPTVDCAERDDAVMDGFLLSIPAVTECSGRECCWDLRSETLRFEVSVRRDARH